ncbi:hypothetical protein [Azospirillum sp. ST 5-10]|uniref:hypothetical protein n=1 Tax=unclassified Azospirillum TaxID=2630922 RepID=UPI003F49E013
MPTLLITSAGSLVADAVVSCLASVRDSLTVVGVNSVAAPAAFACDRLHRVPPVREAAAFAAALRTVLAAERPDLVLAGRDEDVPALAALAAAGEFPDTAFPVPPPALAALLLDKRLCHRFARDHGLPFAPTAEGPDDVAALAAEHGFPLLAKPWRGSGSRDVWLLADERDLAAAAADTALTIQAFCGPESVRAALPAFRRAAARGLPWRWAFRDEEINAELTLAEDGTVATLCLDGGVTAPPFRTGIRLLDDAGVAAAVRAWGEALGRRGHRGPLNIQGKRLADGRFLPYELNPRFGGSAAVRAALGHNQVLHLVASRLGWPAPAMAARAGTGRPATRSFDLPAARRRAFDGDGTWAAPRRPAAPAPPASPAARRVLVAGLGTRHGAALLDTLADRRAGLLVVGAASAPDEPDLRRCDHAVRLPPAGAPDHAERVAALLAAHRIDTAFAASDAALAALSGRTPSLRWVLGPPGAARAAAAAHARAHGLTFVPCATTVAGAAALVRRGGLPVVAKPSRGDGPVSLLETWGQVVAALADGGCVVQPLLGADDLAAQRAAWHARPGAPWTWGLADVVEVAETIVPPDGGVAEIRAAACTQRGGEPADIRPAEAGTAAAASVVEPARRWALSLSRIGHRGPLRLTGKRDAAGRWLPFSVSPYLLGIPDAGTLRTRVAVPAVGGAADHAGCATTSSSAATTRSTSRPSRSS